MKEVYKILKKRVVINLDMCPSSLSYVSEISWPPSRMGLTAE